MLNKKSNHDLLNGRTTSRQQSLGLLHVLPGSLHSDLVVASIEIHATSNCRGANADRSATLLIGPDAQSLRQLIRHPTADSL